ncbi:hypothetical protein KGF54_001814 [Candida jiufengensis]|uniref:uncharacterized protein n=1 Tax=Candida jiufengensis TaxID=497108 RepID=UPI002224563F|nr:uncharacterized protein KGF54_001814 [Candida jiufengensis]KAI5955253.1 hypothetical protein KGF54_001814 [Candida jiufengensis]
MHQDEPLPIYSKESKDIITKNDQTDKKKSSTVKKESKPEPPSYYHPPVGKIPFYFQEVPLKNWSIVINTRYYKDGLVFVGNRSINKYELCKTKKNDPQVIKLQQQGIGIPLFKVEVSSNPLSSKYLIIKRHLPDPQTSFDIDKNYYDYCIVKKFSQTGYTSFVLNIKPDPTNDKTNFQITLFSHTTFPIYDYNYKGQRLRWIEESGKPFFYRLNQVKYGLKHTILSPEQPSLCDNWDGIGNKLNNKPNPLLKSYIKSKIHPDSDAVKPEYYGTTNNAVFGEAQVEFELGKLGLAELLINDIYNTNSNVDYDSLFSLNEECLIMICMASVLKKVKDINAEIWKQSMAVKLNQNYLF